MAAAFPSPTRFCERRTGGCWTWARWGATTALLRRSPKGMPALCGSRDTATTPLQACGQSSGRCVWDSKGWQRLLPPPTAPYRLRPLGSPLRHHAASPLRHVAQHRAQEQSECHHHVASYVGRACPGGHGRSTEGPGDEGQQRDLGLHHEDESHDADDDERDIPHVHHPDQGHGEPYPEHARYRSGHRLLQALHLATCGEEASPGDDARRHGRSEEHTSELQSLAYLVCRLLLEK